VILGSLSGDGLARESAAVAHGGVLWLTNGPRPVPCSPVRQSRHDRLSGRYPLLGHDYQPWRILAHDCQLRRMRTGAHQT
jgi:hypothetical protein